MAWTTPTNVATGDVLTATRYNNEVVGNTYAGGPIYATTVARDAAITAPFVGQRAFITATLVNTQYNGTAWLEVAPIGTWTTFTPQLRTGSTNVASTNNYGRYIVQGKTVTAQAKVTATAAGTAGGVVKVSIPTGTMVQSIESTLGAFLLKDTGTAYYAGVAAIAEAGYISGFAYGSADHMGASTPAMTIAVNDIIAYSVVYEIS